MADRDLYLAWLNDAYAMENGIAQVLEKQINHAENAPQIQSRLRQHLETTRRHAELVKGCIERLGSDTSALKTGAATALGWMQGLSTGAAGDVLIKDAIADFAVEHFEIASYRALIRAAQALGDQQTATTCQQILQDEEEMANWLAQNLPAVTNQCLSQAATAK